MTMAIEGCFGPPSLAELLLPWFAVPAILILVIPPLLLLAFGMTHAVAIAAERIMDAWERHAERPDR